MSDHRASLAAYTTSIGTFFIGWALDNPTQVIAAVCAIGTFAVNWWFKYRQLKLIEARVNQPFPGLFKEEE